LLLLFVAGFTARLRSIAVLPFQNLNQDPAYDQIPDGIALDLINGLSKIRDLRVAATTSSLAFKNHYSDVSDIGRKLKVDTVLEGMTAFY
jgi:TolB-like protein